jgi:hypothetical protein
MELWYCPSGFNIVEHSHPKENVELLYLFGNTIFYRRNLFNGKMESKEVGKRQWLEKFTVNYYHSHWFKVGKLPLVFLNIQRFLTGAKPESAAKDFKVTTEQEKDI